MAAAGQPTPFTSPSVIWVALVYPAMEYEFLKLAGGVLLLWVAVKLVVPDADGNGVCNDKDLKAFGLASGVRKANFFINP